METNLPAAPNKRWVGAAALVALTTAISPWEQEAGATWA